MNTYVELRQWLIIVQYVAIREHKVIFVGCDMLPYILKHYFVP
jgi:hypothetical protein